MSAFPVYLVRHARAEKTHPGGDAARPLSEEGRRAFEALARACANQLQVTVVVTSPFARARETAEILAQVTGARVEEEPALASGASNGRELLGLARRAGPGAALVGHNPELQEAIARASSDVEAVPPGTIASLELDGAAARLAWLVAPEREER